MNLTGGVKLSLQQVYNGFRDAGLPPNQAANLAAVTHIESGGYTGSFGYQGTENGGVLNPNGAYGLAQLNGPRQAGLANYAASVGQSPSDPATQTAYLAQEAQGMSRVNLNSVSSIVNNYESPRQDLRAGEIARSNDNLTRLAGAEDNYTPGSSAATSASASSTPMGDYSNYGGVETSAGSEITSFQPNADGSANVTLGFPSDTAPSTTSIGAGSFAGSYSVAGGLGATDTSITASAPSTGDSGQYSLSGATLDSGTTASTVTGSGDDIAGTNAAGPVVANPALVGATNQVAANTKSGDQGIQSGITTAGQTIAKALGVDTQSWIQWLSDSFLRLAFIVAGLVLFAAALYYFARPQVDATVSAVAKRVPKVIPV